MPVPVDAPELHNHATRPPGEHRTQLSPSALRRLELARAAAEGAAAAAQATVDRAHALRDQWYAQLQYAAEAAGLELGAGANVELTDQGELIVRPPE
jgi:ABC-type sugar transport system substrate-binding protein